MPRYYRKRYYRRRRNYKPRYKRNRRFKSKYNRQTSMRSRNTIAPDIAFTKLKFTYVANIVPATPATLPSPSATLATNFSNRRLIRGNDVYDPQSTSGVASATGFQQWCAQSGLYQEFLVHASKIKVELVNNSNQSVSASLYPLMESNATVTTIDGNEQAYTRTSFIGTNAGNNKVIMKNFMKTKKMIGCKDLSDDNLNYGQYNSSPNPANIWDWALDCAFSDGSVSRPDSALDLKVDVTYYVQFLQRPVVSVSAQS